MDLISAQYGWTDAQILESTLARLTQAVAAIQRRQWLDDLAHRRLETAKLRTLCAYIAATLQLAEGVDNVMLTEAANLSLGTGTENAHPGQYAGAQPEPGRPELGRPEPGRPAMPSATLPTASLPDAPPSIRPGQHAPAGVTGGRVLRLDDIGALFGGAL